MALRRGAVALAVVLSGASAQAQNTLSDYTENVLTHVILHELGHALIREFDLPVLANEEVMADAFATSYVVQNMPDRAVDIIAARAAALETDMDEETVFAEHPDDVWRAGQMICLAYGLDPASFEQLAIDSGMTGNEAGNCRDTAAEVGRAWRRILVPFAMPEGARVTEVRINIGEGPWATAVQNSTLPETLRPIMASFDWHSLVTLQFDNCEGGAYWSRNGRTILVCDDLLARFERQNAAR